MNTIDPRAPRPTPETDAALVKHMPKDATEWSKHYLTLCIHSRKLERERDEARRNAEVERLSGVAVVAMCKRQESEIEAMREAIKEAHEALDWATSNMNPPFAWEPFKKANAALTKLQPFITA